MTRHATARTIAAVTAIAAVLLTGCGDDTTAQTADTPPSATTAPPATPSPTPEATSEATPEPTPKPTSKPTASPTAASVPGFLAGTDLPPHPTSAWFAGKVTAGAPEFAPFCLENALAGRENLWHRTFGTEFDTHATQVVLRTDSVEDAQALVDVLSHAAALCVDDWLAENPEGTGESKDFGAPSAATHVYGVHTSIPDSEPGVHLYGIGSAGTWVSVVQWAQMGDLDDAPVAAFEKTTTTAVAKL